MRDLGSGQLNRLSSRWRKLAVLVLALIGCAIVLGIFTGYGWSGQIRLDCGDLRYCFWGIPISTEPMPEPARSAIVQVARDSTILRQVWRTCVRYPLPTSNNSDKMCRSFYRKASAWIDVDRTIARLALEDVARYVESTGAQYSLPESALILSPFGPLTDNGSVRDDWRQDEYIQDYCQKHGYTIPKAPDSPNESSEIP